MIIKYEITPNLFYQIPCILCLISLSSEAWEFDLIKTEVRKVVLNLKSANRTLSKLPWIKTQNVLPNGTIFALGSKQKLLSFNDFYRNAFIVGKNSFVELPEMLFKRRLPAVTFYGGNVYVISGANTVECEK